jgi:antitoxin HicB
MYPVIIEPDDNGTLLVTCPDLPEVTSWGEDEEEALRHAADAIEEALAARIAHRDEIPDPSAARGRPVANLPPLTVAKVSLYRAARASGVSKAELSRRLGWQCAANRPPLRPAPSIEDRADRPGTPHSRQAARRHRSGRRLSRAGPPRT